MQYTAKTLAALAAVAGVANALPFNGKTQVAKRDFNAKGNNNVAAWWGNSDKTNAAGLDKLCAADYDVIILTFGMAIKGNAVTVAGGAESKSLADSIKKCQSSGKKVMMSMGGATATELVWTSDDQAAKAADVVADNFLKTGANSYYGVALDGIDIDNESAKSAHWQKFVTQLRTHMSSNQYISGAPQCPLPDQSIDQATLKAMDFVWVQFYNNGPCNHGQAGFKDSVSKWSQYIGNAKLYIAAPGDQASAGSGYIDAAAMTKEVADIKAMNLPNFGGYAIWDGSTALLNNNYQSVIKKALGGSTSGGSTGGSGSGSSSKPASGPTSTPKAATPTSHAGHGQQTGGADSGATTVKATTTAHVTSTKFMPSATAPAATSPAASSPTPVTGGSSTGSGSGSAAPGTQSCSDAGKVICSTDGSQFGICNGTSAIMMAVSQGTVCQNGAIAAASSAGGAGSSTPASTTSTTPDDTPAGDDTTTGGDDSE